MKIIQQAALASLTISSFALYAADEVTAQQVTQWVYNGDMGMVHEHKHNGSISADMLATPIPTRFQQNTITEATAQDGQLFRTIADEAAEQFFHDQDYFSDKKCTEEPPPTSAYLLVNHFLSEKARTYTVSNLHVLKRISGINGVSFNPTQKALAKQKKYQQKYHFDDLVPKDYGAHDQHLDSSIPEHCAETLAKENPERALEGMQKLPALWFRQKLDRKGYDLIVRVGVRTNQEEFSTDEGAIKMVSYLNEQNQLVNVEHEETPKVVCNRIFVGDDSYNETYIFPLTNQSSSGQWIKSQRNNFNTNSEEFNYLCTRNGGRHGGRGMANMPAYDFFEQEKKPLSTLKGTGKKDQ